MSRQSDPIQPRRVGREQGPEGSSLGDALCAPPRSVWGSVRGSPDTQARSPPTRLPRKPTTVATAGQPEDIGCEAEWGQFNPEHD
jgi:hypothetical protein